MIVWEALDALSHQLELCKIDATTRVVLLLDSEQDQERSSLIRASIARTGAEALDVRLVRESDSTGNALLDTVVSAADVVVATNASHLAHLRSSEISTLLLSNESVPQNFPPHASLRRRTHAAANQLTRDAVLQITDEHGTSLSIDLAGNEIRFDHGLLDDTNPHATFPSGWVATTPAPGTVSGELVVMPGDGNISARRHISSPVRFEIIDGRISTIHGDSADADVMRAVLEYSDDPDAYHLASIALGLNPGRRLVAPFDNQLVSPRLSRLTAGVLTISFGNLTTTDQPRSADFTLALAMPGRSAAVDGLPLLSAGMLQGDVAPDVYEL